MIDNSLPSAKSPKVLFSLDKREKMYSARAWKLPFNLPLC